jgi:kynurenine formamidase
MILRGCIYIYRMKIFSLWIVIVVLAVPSFAQKWIDLTHPFDSTTLYWPNNKLTFTHTKDYKGFVKPMGYFYSSYSISAPEHGGTHLDAPIHFSNGKQAVDQIPLENLVGEAVVIDVTKSALVDRDYLISIQDWKEWEAQNGRVPNGSIVLFKTGYSAYYPDREKYFGTSKLGDEAIQELHFPGISVELAQWIVNERSIKSFGIDTPSMDYGQSKDFMVHQILLGQNIPGFENVNLSMDLPSKGLYVVAMPMKISQGSGAPLRIMASF